MLEAITIQDLLLIGHRLWYLMDTLTVETRATTEIGEKANVVVKDLYITLCDLHNRVHYIVRDSRNAGSAQEIQSIIQPHLQGFFIDLWNTIEHLTIAVDAVLARAVQDQWAGNMHESRQTRNRAFWSSEDCVWLVDGGNFLSLAQKSLKHLRQHEKPLDLAVAAIRHDSRKRALEAYESPIYHIKKASTGQSENVDENSFFPTGYVENVAGGENRYPSEKMAKSPEGLRRTVLNSDGSIVTEPEELPKIPDHTSSAQSNAVQGQTANRVGEPTTREPLRKKFNPAKRPSKQAYVRNESEEDLLSLSQPPTNSHRQASDSSDAKFSNNPFDDPSTAPSSNSHPPERQASPPIHPPRSPHPRTPLTTNPPGSSDNTTQSMGGHQNPHPRLDIPFEIETWMGGIFAFTLCPNVIINPDLFVNENNKQPIFECTCAQAHSSNTDSSYRNAYKPVTVEGHASAVAQFYGTSNTLIVEKMGEPLSLLLAVNLLEKTTSEGTVDRTLVNELHLRFRDESDAKCFLASVGHFLRARALRALKNERVQKSVWTDWKKLPIQGSPQSFAHILIASSCKIWRESAAGDNSACDWKDNDLNDGWKMLPGHSILREISVYQYMEFNPDKHPNWHLDDDPWKLTFEKSNHAGMSIVGPAGESKIEFQIATNTTSYSTIDGHFVINTKGASVHRAGSHFFPGSDIEPLHIKDCSVRIRRGKKNEFSRTFDVLMDTLKSQDKNPHSELYEPPSRSPGPVSHGASDQGNSPAFEMINSIENIYVMNRPFYRSAFKNAKISVVYSAKDNSMTVVATTVTKPITLLEQKVLLDQPQDAIEFGQDHFVLGYPNILRRPTALNDSDALISTSTGLSLKYQFFNVEDFSVFKDAYDDMYASCINNQPADSIAVPLANPAQTNSRPLNRQPYSSQQTSQQPRKETTIWYKAISDYKAPTFSSKVSLKMNDIVLITDLNKEGSWWSGKRWSREKKTGVFPKALLVPCPHNEQPVDHYQWSRDNEG